VHAFLLVMSLVFTITACAYGMMAVRTMHPDRALMGADEHHVLTRTLDRYGAQLLLGELFVLAILVAAAFGMEMCKRGHSPKNGESDDKNVQSGARR
jgi:hypothetical protein